MFRELLHHLDKGIRFGSGMESLAHVFLTYFALAFLAITFIQSGFDKIVNYRSELDFQKSHFRNSFLADTVIVLLPMLMVMELLSGLCCGTGMFIAIIGIRSILVPLGFLFCGITLLMLLLGQRIAKDYAGAASLTGYFIILLLGVLGLSIYGY